MREIPGGTRARHRSRPVDLPETDTDHSDQTVPVLSLRCSSSAQYDNRASRGAAENHYPVMSTEELAGLLGCLGRDGS